MDAVETGINMVELDINNTMATISRQHNCIKEFLVELHIFVEGNVLY